MTAVLHAPAPTVVTATPAPTVVTATPASTVATGLLAPRRTWGWCRTLDPVVTLGLALAAILTRASHLGAQGFSDDEGTYVAQAWSVVHHGTLSPYTYWYDHPPLGWLLLSLWQVLTSPFLHAATAVGSGRELMVVLAGLDAALLYVAARRLGLSSPAGISAAGLWVLSPLAVDYSRMVFLDGIALPLLLGAFVLALTPRRHLWAYALSGVLLAAAVLCKETILLSAPAVVLAVWTGSAGRTRPYCFAAFGGPAVLLLGFYPLLALLKGELLPGPDHVSLWDALRFQLVDRSSGGSPLTSGSASSHQLASWLALDPVLLLAGVAAALLLLPVRAQRPTAVALLVPVLVGLRPGYLPDPFVIALLPFCALSVAGLCQTAMVAARRRRLPLDARLWAALLTTVTVLGVAVPASANWAPRRRALDSGSAEQVAARTETYLAQKVPKDQRLLVDDSLWVDLIEQGRPEDDVVWFYKTDFTNNLDPSQARALPHGYRDLTWVVSSPVLRAALAQYPQGLQNARLALRYSRVVATFGSGDQRLEVRRVRVPSSAPAAPAPHR